MLYLNGFLLGLSTGIFCFAYCAPVYLPLTMAEKDKRRGWTVFFKFNAGRLAGYVAFGALFGYLGAAVHAQFLKTWSGWVMAVLALLMIAYGLGMSMPKFRLCAWTKKIRMPVVSGLLVGVNICPPFLAAILYNFQTGGIVPGMLFFLFFYLGTTLYFVPVTFLGFFARARWLRRAARLAAVGVGIILLIQTVINIRL